MGTKSLSQTLRANRHWWLLLYVPFYLTWFFILERLITSDYWACYLPIDDWIPFWEGFVVPYVLWYPFMIAMGLYLLFRDIPAFVRYMWFLIFGFTFCLVFYMVVPNGQDLRPDTFARDNLLVQLVQRLYSVDTNTNVFPSMHVVGSVAVAYAVFDSDRLRNGWLRAGTVLLAAVISVSILFVKQHSALDLIGALVLCLPIWLGLRRWRRVSRLRQGRATDGIAAGDPPAVE